MYGRHIFMKVFCLIKPDKRFPFRAHMIPDFLYKKVYNTVSPLPWDARALYISCCSPRIHNWIFSSCPLQPTQGLLLWSLVVCVAPGLGRRRRRRWESPRHNPCPSYWPTLSAGCWLREGVKKIIPKIWIIKFSENFDRFSMTLFATIPDCLLTLLALFTPR